MTTPTPRVTPGHPYAIHATELDEYGLIRETTVCGRRIHDEWVTLPHGYEPTCEECIEAELGEALLLRRQEFRDRELRWTST